jgi:threonine aldolase
LIAGAWLKNAAHGNACAKRLAAAVAGLPGVEVTFPVEADTVFLRMPEETMAALRAKGWRFYTFIGGGARFMFAWDPDIADVDALVADIRTLSGGSR